MVDPRPDDRAHAPTEPGVAASADTARELASIQKQRVRAGLFARRQAPKIGRFTILETLGRGAMGQVYAAYDAELDRRVAVKVVRPDADSEDARRRMLREAQALAKLSHPNVVHVYEVGTHEEGGVVVYIAMELVPGETLRAWCERSEPSSAEIVAAYVQAGRGLAAAHRAGLVHRDFKPDNTLRGHDGRVRVVDFGLARTHRDPSPPDPEGRDADEGEDPGSSMVTAEGQVVGTPAYMAPEQFLARPLDGRSDQFAFCISLWEALFSARPFVGRNRHAIATRVIDGDITPPPAGHRVPPHIVAALERGLRPDPGERFPAMDELLAALEHDPGRARRRKLIVAGSAGALLLVGWAGASFFGDTAQPPCVEVDAPARVAWSAARRDEVGAALRGVAVPYAADVAAQVQRGVDAWISEWSTARREVCESADVRHEHSGQWLDRAMACLDRRLDTTTALLHRLVAADVTTIEHASEAVTGLPSVALCRDDAYLQATVPPPEDPKSAELVASARRQLAQADAARQSHAFALGLAPALAGDLKAQLSGYDPVRAEGRLALAQLLLALASHTSARAALDDAYTTAYAAGHDEVASDASLALMLAIADGDGRPAEGLHWGRYAEAAAARLGNDPARAAAIERRRGDLLVDLADYPAAQEAYTRALSLSRDAHGDEHPDTIAAVVGLADIDRIAGRLDAALARFDEAEALLRALLGDEHPRVAGILSWQAAVLIERGDLDEGIAKLTTLRALLARIYGEDALPLADSLEMLAAAHARGQKWPAALEAFERALAIREEHQSADHPALIGALLGIGGTLHLQGRDGEARPVLERALAIAEARLGESHPNTAMVVNNLANVLSRLGQGAEAVEAYRRVVAINTEAHGADHPATATALHNLALELRTLGRLDEADAEQTRALAILAAGDAAWQYVKVGENYVDALVARERLDDARLTAEGAHARAIDHFHDPAAAAVMSFALARVHEARGDRKAARAAAEAARAAIPADATELLATVDTWLAEHP